MTRERNRRVLLAASVGVAQRLLQTIATIIIIPLVIGGLGQRGFGVWGAATSLAWLGGMLDFGLGAALISIVAGARAQGDIGLARPQVIAALVGATGLGALALAMGGGLVWGFAAAANRAAFLVAVAMLAINVPLGMAGAMWLGLEKGHVSAAWGIVQIGLSTGALIVAILAGGSVMGLVAAFYVGMPLANAGMLAHLLISQPRLRSGRAWSLGILPSIGRTGGLFFLLTALGTLSYALDNVLALAWLGPVAAARVAVALRICINVMALIGVLTNPLWPAFAHAASAGDRPWVSRTLRRGSALLALSAIAGAALLVVYGASLLRWWLGTDLGVNRTLLVATGSWVVAFAVPQVSGIFLNAVSILRFRLVVMGLALIVAFALKVIGARLFGDAGILGATAIAWILIVWPAFAWRVARWEG